MPVGKAKEKEKLARKKIKRKLGAIRNEKKEHSTNGEKEKMKRKKIQICVYKILFCVVYGVLF